MNAKVTDCVRLGTRPRLLPTSLVLIDLLPPPALDTSASSLDRLDSVARTDLDEAGSRAAPFYVDHKMRIRTNAKRKWRKPD